MYGLDSSGRIVPQYAPAQAAMVNAQLAVTNQQLSAVSAKLDGVQEAHLVALACSPAPKGRARWSLRLLADKLVELEVVDDVSYETVRQTLKKTNSSHG